jgi:putative SOS response-associated peptidase YedK
MCGRVTVKSSPKDLADAARAVSIIAAPDRPDFNLPPTREIPVVANTEKRELDMFRWGLVPAWAKDGKKLPLMNNARAEGIGEKRMFASLLQRKRCLVVVDGFYEWKREGSGKNAKKTPFYIRRKDGKPLVFAGLWDQHEEGDHVLRSCTITTCGANQTMAPIHDRMPVILAPESFDLWLSPEKKSIDELTPLLVPAPDTILEAVQVGTLVNSVKNNAPELIVPAPPA